MKPGPLATLFHPFESGALAAPEAGRLLFLGAEPGFRLPDGFGAKLDLVQGFRPHFRALEAAGHKVTSRPEGMDFDDAVLLTDVVPTGYQAAEMGGIKKAIRLWFLVQGQLELWQHDVPGFLEPLV